MPPEPLGMSPTAQPLGLWPHPSFQAEMASHYRTAAPSGHVRMSGLPDHTVRAAWATSSPSYAFLSCDPADCFDRTWPRDVTGITVLPVPSKCAKTHPEARSHSCGFFMVAAHRVDALYYPRGLVVPK